MTYRVYIRNDSNAEITQSYLPKNPLLFAIFAALLITSTFFYLKPSNITVQATLQRTLPTKSSIVEITKPKTTSHEIKIIEIETPEPEIHLEAEQNNALVIHQHDEPIIQPLDTAIAQNSKQIIDDRDSLPTLNNENLADNAPEVATEEELLGVLTIQRAQQSLGAANNNLHEVVVKKGDNMAIIFNRLSLSPQSLHNIMSLGKETAVLKSINPGEIIEFKIKDKQLLHIKYDYDLTKTLLVKHDSGKFIAETTETEIEKRIRYASAEINSSLFLAGQRSGITDKVIMNLVSIYGWDIDFALDIRSGDKFAILYEEHFKNGKKINNGPILAAEFINNGYKFRAVRYIHNNGDINYYSDTGHNMRKAFMRSPVNFSRISSHFNLKRKHPVLNKIRAHKGVDYAARTGTPIKATGDGIVMFKGNKGGYGRTVILKHGGTYTTLYAHMSKYAKGVNNGVRVKQGQTIGYIGKSGLATGPHLHYEFRINGVHRNPLKVKLPKALRIPEEIMADFKQKTRPILAQLDQYITQSEALASLPISKTENTQVLAMRKTDQAPESMTH